MPILRYLLVDHRLKPVVESALHLDLPADCYVLHLKQKIIEDDPSIPSGYRSGDLRAWKVKESVNVNTLSNQTACERFVTNICPLPDVVERTRHQRLAKTKLVVDETKISDLEPLLDSELHFIVKLSTPVAGAGTASDGTSQPLATPTYRELIIQLPDSIRTNDLSEDEVELNDIRARSSSVRLQELQERLQRKRYIDGNRLLSPLRLPLRDFFPQDYLPVDHFFAAATPIPEDIPPLDRVTDEELTHYINILGSRVFHVAVFSVRKEHHIYALLINFVRALTLPACSCLFGQNLPLSLVVHRAGRQLMYTPRPDFQMRIRGFPHILLEVNSQRNESDRYRMLLQAGCLARFGNRDKADQPVVIMAIYISAQFEATQYLVSAVPSTEASVEYTYKKFDLSNPATAFEFMFEMYNFVSLAKINSDKINIPEILLSETRRWVVKQNLDHLTTTANPPTNLDSDPPQAGPSGTTHDSFDDLSVQEGVATAGFTFHEIPEGFTPLPALKSTMRGATSRDGVSVILKITRDSNEQRFLQHLGDIKDPSNHTIPLLAVIDLSIGKTIIALPWMSTLDCVLQFRECPDDVTSLCHQFIEGMAFLHQHNIAHRDIKSDNVVVDVKRDSKMPPRLFIIDFELAQFVENEETLVEGFCGTPTWTAPELGSKNDATRRYSPILADRWACGRMIEHITKYIPIQANKQHLLAFAQQLLNVDPKARPPLNQLPGIARLTKRKLLGAGGSEVTPAAKRHEVD